MESVQEFLAMGGYAEFIWPSYVVTALVLGVLWLVSGQSLRRSERTVQTLQQARQTDTNRDGPA